MAFRNHALIALLSGAAAALGHAPFGLWFIAVPGFAALIWTVSRATTPRRAFGRAWLCGAAYFAVALHWIVEPFLVDAATHGWMAPFALILMAGGLALFWGLAGWLSTRMRWPAVGFAASLAFMEIVRGHIFTGFPWALPAYVWADTWLLQSAALLGPYGLTALTLIALSLPSAMQRPAFGAGIAAFAFAGMTAISPFLVTAPGDTLGTVRLVQPNASQDQKWDPAMARVFLDRLIEGTAAEGDPDLIVWPESAIAWPLDIAGPILSRASSAAGGTGLVTGINRRVEADEWYNSLIVLDETGLVADTYDKVHLVPFGEYIPFRIDFLRAMAAMSNFGFTKGAEVRLIDTQLGRALPLICYEAIFPGHGRNVDERPDYLLQLTNDAWFGEFSGPYQHLDQARFRAVEQGLPLIRAANTGVSAVIGPEGQVRNALALGESGFVDVAVPAGRPEPTLYSRLGDLPIACFLFVTMIALWFARKRNAIAKPDALS